MSYYPSWDLDDCPLRVGDLVVVTPTTEDEDATLYAGQSAVVAKLDQQDSELPVLIHLDDETLWLHWDDLSMEEPEEVPL